MDSSIVFPYTVDTGQAWTSISGTPEISEMVLPCFYTKMLCYLNHHG